MIMNKIKEILDSAEAIVIGAGAGLSTAAGFEYGGKTFMDNFKYMNELYGYKDMYSAGFHFFDTEEEKWAYWSKMIFLNRYNDDGKPLYKQLYNLVKDKNYFVITTNVDHQFQKAGFDKNRLFYMQGDYGLFQCSNACHNKTYDNYDLVMQMIRETKNHRIPSYLVPHCPVCHKEMTTNLRCDEFFVEDEGWHNGKHRYDDFIKENKKKKIVFLELGVGYSTPTWIKYPFMNMTYNNKNATYICVNKDEEFIPDEIVKQSILVTDINDLFR